MCPLETGFEFVPLCHVYIPDGQSGTGYIQLQCFYVASYDNAAVSGR